MRTTITVGVVVVFAVATLLTGTAVAREPAGLHAALETLARKEKFSGAVVVRDDKGVRFARGYGLADPFTGRRFTPDTPVDSASLAKPVTATAVLMLVRDGKIDLDAPARSYIPSYPYEQGTVRQLLSHSAGLPENGSADFLAGKTNEMFLTEMTAEKLPPLFPPGAHFVYCNMCYTTLALLVERVSGKPYLQFVRERVALPPSVTIRPAKLSDWTGRAVGYRRAEDGKVERADSYENELLYGAANFSLSANQLARWGAEWWKPGLAPIRSQAVEPAVIAGRKSGLTLGNWYCAPGGRRCDYHGHHEGFHHMLYWDADRRVSIAMVSNNTLAPELQQRLQRAIVAFAEDRADTGRWELANLLPTAPAALGAYRLSTGEQVGVIQVTERKLWAVERAGLPNLAYAIGSGIRYVPGLDVYIAGGPGGQLRWLGLHEDLTGTPIAPVDRPK